MTPPPEAESAAAARGDAELIARCLDGDAAAWEALVQRYRRLVYSVPLRMRLAVEDADEVFQETFVALLEKLATVRDRERVGLWLAVTARRKALDRVSRGARAHEVESASERDAPDPGELPLDQLVLLERQNAVRQALERIDRRCRSLLEALYYEDPPLPYAEISKRLRMPVGSLGPTRARCFGKLRRALEETPG